MVNYSKLDSYVLKKSIFTNNSAVGVGYANNMDLYGDVTSLNSYKAISDVIDGVTLFDEQTKAIVQCLYNSKCLIRGTTGSGKTLIAKAIMSLIKTQKKKEHGINSKFLYIAKANQRIQTPKKLISGTNLSIVSMNAGLGEITSFIRNNMFEKSDIIYMTHEGLDNEILMEYLYYNRHSITGIFIDEAHDLCNYTSSVRAEMLKRICVPTEYVFAMTATPITSSAKQLLQLLTIIDPVQIPTLSTAKYILENDTELEYLRHMIVTVDKEKCGSKVTYRPFVHRIDPTEEQYITAKSEFAKQQSNAYAIGLPDYVVESMTMKANRNVFISTRGETAYPQRNKVLEIVKSYQGRRGIIYAWNHIIREPLVNFLEDNGVKVGSINGKVSLKKKKKVMDDFNSGLLDVVITSTSEALDLESSYILFYEYTKKIEQVVGRGYRGYDDKVLDIHFLFTRDTGEEEYFYEEIYKISVIMKGILKLNFDVALDVNRILNTQDGLLDSIEENITLEDEEDEEVDIDSYNTLETIRFELSSNKFDDTKIRISLEELMSRSSKILVTTDKIIFDNRVSLKYSINKNLLNIYDLDTDTLITSLTESKLFDKIILIINFILKGYSMLESSDNTLCIKHENLSNELLVIFTDEHINIIHNSVPVIKEDLNCKESKIIYSRIKSYINYVSTNKEIDMKNKDNIFKSVDKAIGENSHISVGRSLSDTELPRLIGKRELCVVKPYGDTMVQLNGSIITSMCLQDNSLDDVLLPVALLYNKSLDSDCEYKLNLVDACTVEVIYNTGDKFRYTFRYDGFEVIINDLPKLRMDNKYAFIINLHNKPLDREELKVFIAYENIKNISNGELDYDVEDCVYTIILSDSVSLEVDFKNKMLKLEDPVDGDDSLEITDEHDLIIMIEDIYKQC